MVLNDVDVQLLQVQGEVRQEREIISFLKELKPENALSGMENLVFIGGLQYSGKSTFCRELERRGDGNSCR